MKISQIIFYQGNMRYPQGWSTLIICTIFLLAGRKPAQAQAIHGYSKELAGQEVALRVFDRFRDTVLVKATVDTAGGYTLPIPARNTQMGILQMPGKDMLVLLDPAGDSVYASSMSKQPVISFKKNGANDKIDHFFRTRSEQKINISAIDFLLGKYNTEHTVFQQSLITEKKRLVNSLSQVDRQLDDHPGDFAAYISRLQVWISDAQTAITSGTQMKEHTRYFEQQIDLKDNRLFKTGLIKTILEIYYKLLESQVGSDFDQVKKVFNRGTDTILYKLNDRQELQAEYANYLFHWFEGISMPSASEYLSLKMLNSNSCQLPDALSQRMEQYRALAIGKTAPDIVYEKSGQQQALSKVTARYKLVFFWASWCEHCKKEIPVLHEELQLMREKGIEVVAVSLDNDPSSYKEAIASYHWDAYCDFKGFESSVAKSYHIFATPTFFMLDQDMKIIYKPVSVDALKAWVKLL